ncbi:MAG TPA: nuclear transport factor 2 family protein [Acidimicrobiales bacterium]
MNGPAADTIRKFGEIENDQRYTRLLELFSDDPIYYDPFAGALRGKDAIHGFLAHLEIVVPKMNVHFDEWEVAGDTDTGWARWVMHLRDPDGVDVPVSGQSLYRLLDGKVCFVADHLDPGAYRKARPGSALPDHAAALGLSAQCAPAGRGPALQVVDRLWEIQASRQYSELASLFTDDAVFTDLVYGRFEGAEAISGFLAKMQSEMPALGVWFERVDAAGDETVAWSQWWCHLPNGQIPGWTLHTVRDGQLTLDSDYYDTAAAAALGTPPAD